MIDRLTPARFWFIAIVSGLTLAVLCWLALIALATVAGLRW